MRFSEKWLREWVDPDLTTVQLTEQLTMAGLEVDCIVPAAQPFRGVVIGEVESIEVHPKGSGLKVCQIDVGSTQTLTIVCGAQNIDTHQKVAVALEGAHLRILHQPQEVLKSQTIQGVVSQGMVCSAKELGLAEISEGIMILPKIAPVGQPLWDYLGLEDICIEVD
ncbi:MAG TPA: phenylalanine--tRNA ligase subunit beta, partial [Gammaproteobacteria bacterium]|nr:phenylalanine--tRNA ligase subunit beta [Gammaproteobacteria bacterium]